MIENAISQRRQRKLASFQSGENAASKDIKKSGFRGLSAGALILKCFLNCVGVTPSAV